MPTETYFINYSEKYQAGRPKLYNKFFDNREDAIKQLDKLLDVFEMVQIVKKVIK